MSRSSHMHNYTANVIILVYRLIPFVVSIMPSMPSMPSVQQAAVNSNQGTSTMVCIICRI